jgi:hypothetical protein
VLSAGTLKVSADRILTGIGAVDINKLKSNGYYTIAVSGVIFEVFAIFALTEILLTVCHSSNQA